MDVCDSLQVPLFETILEMKLKQKFSKWAFMIRYTPVRDYS